MKFFVRRVKSFVSKFYGFVNLRVNFNNTCLPRSQIRRLSRCEKWWARPQFLALLARLLHLLATEIETPEEEAEYMQG